MKQSYLAIAAALFCCLTPLCAQAGDERAINVVGEGEVLVKPDALEMDVQASASAELTGDAAIKYQASARRLRGALQKLEMKNMVIEERALHIGNGSQDTGDEVVFIGQPQAAAAKPSVHIARSLRLTVRGIDKMAEAEVIDVIGKLIDTAKDAGATVGGGASKHIVYQSLAMNGGNTGAAVRFVVEHPDEPREQAYRKAFDNAKSRATRLAKLAGKQLGDTISMDEETAVNWVSYGNRSEPAETSRLSSDELKQIPVRVLLRVRFELVDIPAEPTTRVFKK